MTLNDMKVKYKAKPKILKMIYEIEDLQNWAHIKEIEIINRYEDYEKKINICTHSKQILILKEKLERLNAELNFIRTSYDEKFIMIQSNLINEIKNI